MWRELICLSPLNKIEFVVHADYSLVSLPSPWAIMLDMCNRLCAGVAIGPVLSIRQPNTPITSASNEEHFYEPIIVE